MDTCIFGHTEDEAAATYEPYIFLGMKNPSVRAAKHTVCKDCSEALDIYMSVVPPEGTHRALIMHRTDIFNYRMRWAAGCWCEWHGFWHDDLDKAAGDVREHCRAG